MIGKKVSQSTFIYEVMGFCWIGGLLLARSTAAMLCLTFATSQAAKQGAIPMAAHQICMQTWLAASLLSDAIALAAQVYSLWDKILY